MSIKGPYVAYYEDEAVFIDKITDKNTYNLIQKVVKGMLVYDTNARRYFAEWFGTREEYDNLPVKANNTKYCVREVSGDASFYFFGYDDTILEGAKRDGTVNVKDLSTFDEWIGTEGEFSAITNRRGNTKYAVTNNNIVTNFVKVADKPDNRISLSVAGGPFGLELWNNPNDPMPIKTINMAGLQKWEETDDYIIYLDKDAVMTTVESYVTGTYDLFLDRKADVDGAMELLKMNNIEWTAEDDSKLILDINKAQLERIANTPTTMEEEDFATQTFTTRAVPTTYECCFRVDKKSGEIYIGEGYENLWNPTQQYAVSITGTKDDFILQSSSSSIQGYYRANTLVEPVIYNVEYTSYGDIGNGFMFSNNGSTGPHAHTIKDGNNTFSFAQLSWANGLYGVYVDAGTTSVHKIKNLQITKTSTPKPFVKSIMPSGKLAFVTEATSETHSFIFKDYKVVRNVLDYARLYVCGAVNTTFERASIERITTSGLLQNNPLISKFYKNYTVIQHGVSGGALIFTAQKANTDSFKQLLIYKGNLTEAELKAENEKDIRLK